ncbi:MAG TPA: zf-HC2 domain-containing protein [Vicinamibacterales bacterium]|nr:zf-HC2 domain-containing protein [Vicinamibacterales bacterium]
MTQYVGCDHARTLLEGLIDGELSMADQLAVESHLRWCDTCALRVEDMRLIGASLRATSAARPADDVDEGALTVLTESLLVRVRTERAQSFASRVREMVTDSRLLWPALGATASVLLCVAAATSVLRASTIQEPDSLAAMISALGSPGSEMRPLRPADNGISFPRLSENDGMRASGTIEQIPEDDVIYAFRTVIGRDGSLSDTELLSGDDTPLADRRAVARALAQEMALLNAVNTTRFVPAQTPLGHAVAVDMVWLVAKTTVAAPDLFRSQPARVETRVKVIQKPAAPEPAAPPLSGQPAALRDSSTA